MIPSLPAFTAQLALAAGLGAAVGLERQWHQGMAGLRTNALVATAAAAFVGLPAFLNEEATGPAHMAASLMTGIGFLGTGVILREGANVRGLNTAATLWATAAAGAFTGAGLWGEGAVIAAAIIGINVCMRPVVKVVNWVGTRLGGGSPIGYVVELSCPRARERHVRALLLTRLKAARLNMHALALKDAVPAGSITIVADVIAYGVSDIVLERIVGELVADPAVTAAQWSLRGGMDADPRLHLGS